MRSSADVRFGILLESLVQRAGTLQLGALGEHAQPIALPLRVVR